MTNRSAVPSRSQAVPGTDAGRPFRRSPTLSRERGNGYGLEATRLSSAVPGTGAPTGAGLVLLTAEQVSQLAHDAAAAALAEFAGGQAPVPELVDGPAMCRLISVSRATLHRLRVGGMPAISVGDTFRYRPAAVIAWLEQRSTK